ncbi:DUF982 domain-containing protein [Mesorhizobium sp. M1307]|uniref:DUF982 domain-containing protein n=1 Tax=Mesorhizobium sp. M1307 TaxID=2957079 RepID=UPI0033354B43
MRAFSPITICLNRNLTVVASIADAMKVLQQPWPRMGKPGRLNAIRMVEESLAGHWQPASCARGLQGGGG